MQRSGAECERSEQRGGAGERSELSVRVWRAKRAAGGAAGRPRIVAEGDVLRVINKWSQNDKRFSKPSKLQTKFLNSQNDKKEEK